MKQKTFAFYDSYDAVEFLEKVKLSSDYKSASSVLVNIFTDRTNPEFISYISKIIKKRLEKAKLSGLTCIAGFASGEELHSVTILSVLFFYSSEVDVIEFDFSKESPEKVKHGILTKLKHYPDLKGIQVFSTPLKNSYTNEILSEITSTYENVQIFGAGAAFGIKSKNKSMFVFGKGVYENALVLTLFSGKALKIYAESTLGWTPIGKEMTATEVLDGKILKTIDNETAGEVYKKYLGVVSVENFIDNTCEFPFMIRRSGKWIARVPLQKDENGYVRFAADINENEKLVFSYGAKNLILKSSFNLAEYMSQKNLDAVLLHVCRTRSFYLKEAGLLEMQAFSNFYRETCGTFSLSEILYKNKNGAVLNSSLVAVGFKEIENPENEPDFQDCYIEDVRHGNNHFIDFDVHSSDFSAAKKLMPFEERIVNFLHATSRDFNILNSKLEEAATTDGLTKLLNRKKISEVIEASLKEKSNSSKINLIMFDIDNFKHINDTYGHDVGDEVLRVVSKTAKECLSKKDSIGRWGGEEFMILISDTPKSKAVEIAEEIRTKINSLEWENMNKVSVSVGVCEVQPDDDSTSIYKRVDSRLYYAKTHGKNCVISETLS